MSLQRSSLARIGNASLNERSQLSAFFASAEEEYSLVLPFIRAGLERGENAFHALDPARAEDHRRRLAAANIDVEHYRRTGQLELMTWDEVQLVNGVLEPDATAAVLGKVRAQAAESGYRITRFVAHMDWITPHQAGLEQLLLSEARWNAARGQFPPCRLVRIYDLRKHRADVIIAMMRTHPQVLVGRTAYENPFFVPPDELAGELAARLDERNSRSRRQ